jgi:hypothetical protein
MSTRVYEYTHSTLMITFERLSQFDFEVYEVDHQSVLLLMGTSTLTKRIISSITKNLTS